MSLEEIQRFAEAGKLADAVVLAKIQAVNALQAAAMINNRLNELEEAIRLAKLAVDVEPSCAKLHGNLSYFFGNQSRLDEALDAINRAIELAPDVAEFHCNKAVILSGMKRIDEAARSYRKALERDPGSAYAKFNLGCMLALLGQHEEGLECLEARFANDPELKKFRSRFDKPDWNGEDLTGKRLLVYSEQGAGDAIQHVRYVPQLKKAFLIGEIPHGLVFLLAGFFDVAIGREPDYDISNKPTDLPDYDYVVSFSSLPYLLDPDLANIPPTPYLQAEKSNLRVDPEKLNIGIVWAGSHLHSNDAARSCPVRYLLPLRDLPGVQLYSLQKGPVKREYWGTSVDFGVCAEVSAIDLSEQLNDFSETAKVISALDLIVTVDTAVAHLAGALGKPVALMLPFCHDHRWLLDAKSTPWYSGMRLYRQEKAGDWEGVVAKVVSDIKVVRI